MEENNVVNNTDDNNKDINPKKDNNVIAGAIILAGILIAGAILLKGSASSVAPGTGPNNGVQAAPVAKVGSQDRTMGNPQAKVAVVLYEDFQCPFCGAVNGSPASQALIQSLQQREPNWSPFVPEIINGYVKNGTVQFVYRDFAFLGPESFQAAEAARCAADQGKFWEYHDYLFNHQNGENKGSFSDPNLKLFAKVLSLDTASFNQCLDGNKYMGAVNSSKTEATNAGVTGTPKGFILKNGKTVSTIDGAESWATVKVKLDAALK